MKRIEDIPYGEFILCAAIRRLEPKKCSPYYKGTNDITNIELGYRHHDIFQRFPGEMSRRLEDQGFYTSGGRFVDRREAMIIAARANQLKDGVQPFRPNPDIVEKDYPIINPLYSEDLY